MTVETFQSHAPAVASTGVPDAVQTLRAWASTYAEVASFVAPLVDTPFCPDAFRPRVDPRATPDEKRAARDVAVASATAAVLYGAGIGFDPLTSLQNVYVVGGRPGLYAAAMVAVVQAAGHEVWTEDITDSRAVVCGRRRGTDQVERVTVTIDGAKRAGWTRNQKYATEPQAMLWARAASTVCRRIAQDALKGIGRSVEELEDSEVQDRAPAATRAVQRVQRPAVTVSAAPPPPVARPVAAQAARPATAPAEAAGGPPLPGEDDEQQQDTGRAPITKATWNAINAEWARLGITGEGMIARRLTGVRRLVDRPEIEQGSDLTAAEGLTVRDTLASIDPGTVEGMARLADVLGEPAPAPSEEEPATTEDDIDPTLDPAFGTDAAR